MEGFLTRAGREDGKSTDIWRVVNQDVGRGADEETWFADMNRSERLDDVFGTEEVSIAWNLVAYDPLAIAT